MKQNDQASFAAKAKVKVQQQSANQQKPTTKVAPKPVSKVAPKVNVQSSKDTETMPLGKMNYIMIGICLFLIALGFFLMSGSSNEGSTFNNDVFSSTRIVVAPFITFLGFILMVPAIIYRGKKNEVQ